MQIELYNGFWHIETAWRYHQYFNIFENRFWLREKLFKYVKLLGCTKAYACAEYMTWNSGFWKEEQTTFDYWLAECVKDMGHEISILNTEDVRASTDPFYYKDQIYLDTFADLV